MIGSSEQEAAIPLTLLISNLCVREWKIKATKIQGTPLSKISRDPGTWGY